MKFIPYITLNGEAAKAVEFYTGALGATNRGIMRFGDTPNPEYPIPEEARQLVLHAELEVEGNLLYLSDTFPGSPYAPGNLVAIAVVSGDEQRIKVLFERLSDGGTVLMALQKTFWSPAFAMVRDRFGVVWQLSLQAA